MVRYSSRNWMVARLKSGWRRSADKSCIQGLFGHSVAVPGHGVDDAGLKIHRPNPAVVEISQVEIFASRAESDAINVAKLGGVCRTAIAAETFPACAGEWENHSGLCIDSSHAVIPGVGNEQIVSRTDREAVHAVESRL